jgi:hypothetical protein
MPLPPELDNQKHKSQTSFRGNSRECGHNTADAPTFFIAAIESMPASLSEDELPCAAPTSVKT